MHYYRGCSILLLRWVYFPILLKSKFWMIFQTVTDWAPWPSRECISLSLVKSVESKLWISFLHWPWLLLESSKCWLCPLGLWCPLEAAQFGSEHCACLRLLERSASVASGYMKSVPSGWNLHRKAPCQSKLGCWVCGQGTFKIQTQILWGKKVDACRQGFSLKVSNWLRGRSVSFFYNCYAVEICQLLVSFSV